MVSLTGRFGCASSSTSASLHLSTPSLSTFHRLLSACKWISFGKSQSSDFVIIAEVTQVPMPSSSLFQCTSLPPYASSCSVGHIALTLWKSLTSMFAALIADKYRARSAILLFGMTASLIGYIILYASYTSGVRYFGAFMAAAGSYGAFPSSEYHFV